MKNVCGMFLMRMWAAKKNGYDIMLHDWIPISLPRPTYILRKKIFFVIFCVCVSKVLGYQKNRRVAELQSLSWSDQFV